MLVDLTTKIEGELFQKIVDEAENKHVIMGHIGTHLDTYNKTNIPLEYFKSNGVLIDVSSISEERDVELSDMSDVLIEENDFVIFHTNRIEKEKYGTKEYFYNHPQLSHEVIDYLISCKIRFIGIDCAGIRRKEEHQPADELCEKNGCYVIENMCNLKELKNKSFGVYTMWLDDIKATGLKCRVIADML